MYGWHYGCANPFSSGIKCICTATRVPSSFRIYCHAKKNNMSLIPPGNAWNLLTNILNQSQSSNILFYSHKSEWRIKTCTISGLKNSSGRDGISWNLLKFRAPVLVNILRPRQNGRHFADDTFKRVILILLEFRLRFRRSLFLRTNQQYSSFGSDNGLVPTRRQAITWTNDG